MGIEKYLGLLPSQELLPAIVTILSMCCENIDKTSFILPPLMRAPQSLIHARTSTKLYKGVCGDLLGLLIINSWVLSALITVLLCDLYMSDFCFSFCYQVGLLTKQVLIVKCLNAW